MDEKYQISPEVLVHIEALRQLFMDGKISGVSEGLCGDQYQISFFFRKMPCTPLASS